MQRGGRGVAGGDNELVPMPMRRSIAGGFSLLGFYRTSMPAYVCMSWRPRPCGAAFHAGSPACGCLRLTLQHTHTPTHIHPPTLNAVYEAGRALMGYLTPQFDEIQRVSVCPGGAASGYTYFLPRVRFST